MTDQLEWVDLSDFTPGIHADYHAGLANSTKGAVLRNGAATIANTFRCCADPAGALIPLPRTTVGNTMTIPNGLGVGSYYPAGMGGWYLTDAALSGAMSESYGWTRVGALPDDLNKEGAISVYGLYQFMYSLTGDNLNYRQMVIGRVWRNYASTPDIKDFMWESTQGITYNANKTPGQILSGTLTPYRANAVAAGSVINFSDVYPGIAVTQRIISTHGIAAIIAGELPLTTFDTDISANYPTSSGLAGFILLHPKPTTPSFFSVQLYNKSSMPDFPSMSVGHQGRVVTVCRYSTNYNGAVHMRDAIHFTAVNDPMELSTLPNTGFVTEFGEENTSGVGAIASITGNELLLVKHRDGGYLVQGDLKNPTVTRLPYIESTYGVAAMPAHTPLGVVYGSRNGIFAWRGGDQSVKLSEQLDGFFWNHSSDVKYEANRGRLAWWHPWVMVPNNFMFDTRTKGWWRLTDPADYASVPYNVYQVDPTSGTLYAFPYKVTQSQTAVFHKYDPTVLEDAYSWNSQPLIETRDRRRTFQRIRLVAASASNANTQLVTVTLTGHNEDGTAATPVTTSFQWTGNTSSRPIVLDKVISPNFIAYGVQVQIVAANLAGGTAPKVMSVQLGTADRQRTPKAA